MKADLSYKQGGFVAEFHGDIDDADVTLVNDRIYASPDFDEHNYQLFDFSDASLVADPKSMKMVAAIDSAAAITREGVRVATVVTDPDSLAMAKLYVDHSLNMNPSWLFEIFDDRSEAEAWALEPA